MEGRFIILVRKFNHKGMEKRVLEGLSRLVEEPLTLNDVGIEAVRLNYDELDLRLIPDDVQEESCRCGWLSMFLVLTSLSHIQ